MGAIDEPRQAGVCASSASCFDARPSASKVSSSSGVPANRHGALFNGCQSSLHNFLDGLIGTPTKDGLNPSLLFRHKMNRHGVLLPVFVVFSVGENGPSGKSDKGSLSAREETGGGWLQVIGALALAALAKSILIYADFPRVLSNIGGNWP